jgi:hypothetical protein
MGGKYCGALFQVQNDVSMMFSRLQVAFALLLQPPAYFGYIHFDMTEEFNIDKVINTLMCLKCLKGAKDNSSL